MNGKKGNFPFNSQDFSFKLRDFWVGIALASCSKGGDKDGGDGQFYTTCSEVQTKILGGHKDA